MKVLQIGLLVLLISAAPVNASWLSDITGINIDVPAGRVTIGPPRPDRIPMMLQNLPQDVSMFFLNPTGGALAFAIRNAKEQARYGCRPIPDQVRSELSRFFPADILGGVCYNLVSAQRITLDNLLLRHFEQRPAITLEDVIVFRDAAYASDSAMWAHELAHVLQYRRLGLEAFAHVYMFQFQQMENEASGMENFVRQNLSTSGRQPLYEIVGPSAQPISQQQWSYGAQQAINPLQCSGSRVEGRPGGLLVIVQRNDCPIPIQITELSFFDPQGYPVTFPCGGSHCIIPANRSSDFPMLTGFQYRASGITW